MLGTVLIRDATPEDWAAIWPFLHRIVATGETFVYDRDTTEDRARSLWLLERPGRTVVAVDADQTILATAKVHPNHGGPGAHVATASFMVDPQHAGRGVGPRRARPGRGTRRGLPRHAVQRRGREQHSRGPVVALAGFRCAGHRPRGLSPPSARLRRTARHAPSTLTGSSLARWPQIRWVR
ncbi:MAG: GNAT family N-acetyltransferase [Pseudonocardiaceae bacterium]